MIDKELKCIFTGLPIICLDDRNNCLKYDLEIGKYKYLINIPIEAEQWDTQDQFFRDNKYLFCALLHNNKWFEGNNECISLNKLKELLDKTDYPRTPKQKSENLFYDLYKRQREDGNEIQINGVYWHDNFWQNLYFRSIEETIFYIKNLHRNGLIEVVNSTAARINSLKITFAGLEHAIKLEYEGNKSKKCFIAMSFRDETKDIREAIKKALRATGYEAIIIDEKIIDSDRTINDEIISSLKKCKFCIADFSYHSKGVYFESGFALGQGKKVIYTCSRVEFEGAHFDIRPLQHIIYETPNQLTKDLVFKIEAFIN